jgi:hypothetical protein
MKRCARKGCKRLAPHHRKWCLQCRRDDRAFKLKKRYGLSQADFNERLAAQDDTCPICEEPLAEKMAVDHCHDTLIIRDILCMSCNLTLGNARDDHRRLRRAASYLLHHRKHQGRRSFYKRNK